MSGDHFAGHTPGPWHWTKDGLRSVDGQLILAHANINPATADAQLIAAAPAMHDRIQRLEARLASATRNDSLDESLNPGDGSYKP